MLCNPAAAFAVAVSLLVLAVRAQDPSYDHQTTTYQANIPVYKQSNKYTTVEPFFSPTTSISTETDLINQATKSILISTPGFSSWSGCTDWSTQTTCVGCNVTFARNGEAFPVFRALLNAIHRGVEVHVLTNDYNEPACTGQIDPLSFLQLAGGSVRYYTSTTFTHLKFLATDDDTVAVSSVNFSKTSFTMNREAGMVFRDNAALTSYLIDVVERDWAQAYPLQVAQSYSSSDMAIIKDTSHLSPNVPTPGPFSCSVGSTSTQAVSGSMDIVAFASPDSSYGTFMGILNNTKSSLQLSIYQITDMRFCNKLIDLAAGGVDLSLFVSDHIFSADDYALAQKCYQTLFAKGIKLKKADSKCLRFDHQKYAVVDGKAVFLSSGNMSPSDYPGNIPGFDNVFPPFGQAGWRVANRDLNLFVTNAQVVGQFMSIFNIDFANGWWYNG